MSTFKCEVVVVHPRSHPNADRLEVAQVYGYSAVIGKGDFQEGELGVYIPPDSIVPALPVFKFVWEMKGYVPGPEGLISNQQIPEKYRRIKARTLRGVPSEGLLMPLKAFPQLYRSNPDYCQEDARQVIPVVEEGDDVSEILGITHYDPPDPISMGGECERSPIRTGKKRGYPKTLRGWFRFILSKVYFWRQKVVQEEATSLTIPDYDIEPWQKYGRLLEDGEEIWITEKIHGANSRFVYMPYTMCPGGVNGRMYCGSHHQWKKETMDSAWWKCLYQNPWILDFCRAHPGFVLYGELVPTQKLKYGQEGGKYRLFAFDVLDTNRRTPESPNGIWLGYRELADLPWHHTYMVGEDTHYAGILDSWHWVPTVGIECYNPDSPVSYRALSNGPSLVPHANHLREGIVIKPITERYVPRFGRLILKLRSVEYLGSKQSEE